MSSDGSRAQGGNCDSRLDYIKFIPKTIKIYC